MSLSNPPPAVTALRDMLLLCASVTSYGIDTVKIWYPEATATPDAGTAVTLPYLVVAEPSSARTRYADGAGGLPSGLLTATVYAVDTIENLETLGRAIEKELQELQVGLYISDARSELAGRTSLAAEAQAQNDTGANISGIQVTVTYGLGA